MTAAAGAGSARLLRAAGAALPGGLGVLAALGALALLARPDAWSLPAVAAGIALGWIAWMRPVAAVAILLVLAPVCGHRPTTGPYLAFVALTACAVPGWLARLVARDRAIARDLLASPVGLALLAYCGASVLSLASLPLYAPADLVGGAASIGDAVRRLPGALAEADVAALAYPLLTVILTLHAGVAALSVAVALRRPQPRPAVGGLDAAALVTGAVLLGLVTTIAAGALDRLGLLDLRLLRATDPFTNPSGADRLQSTFGHAGWFAQYVCFATPAILALWLWPAGRDHGPKEPRDQETKKPRAQTTNEPRGAWGLMRVVAAVVLLALALTAIVLSYQRGGWLTWAVIGSGVVAAIVALGSSGSDRVAAASLPAGRMVTAAVAAVAVAVAAGLLVVRVAGGPRALERFAERARTITQVSDRQVHVMAGLRLGALLPVLGGGSESFAMRYQQEYLLAGGAYYDRGRDPLYGMYGSAHNVFAQTFAGKGAAGVAALAWLVVAALVAAGRTLRRAEAPPPARVVAAIALGMIAAFAIYGQVQEVFYVPSLQLTVFAGVGLALALAPAADPPARAARRLGAVAVLLLVVLGAHLTHGYLVSGRLAEDYRDRAITQAGQRLSPPLLGEDGEYFQWTGGRAVLTVPRQATELSFQLRRSGASPVDVDVRFDGRSIDRVRLDDDGWRSAVYPLQRVRALPRRLEIVVTGGGDRGVAVRRVRWGLP